MDIPEKTGTGRPPRTLDLVMLSNFGRADGGRETWAYNFLPLLLNTRKDLRLKLYGFTPSGEPDNTATLLCALQEADRERMQVRFFPQNWSRLPRFFSMFFQLREAGKRPAAPPHAVLGVGGLFEMLMLCYTPMYRRCRKILWLRSIFWDEKAGRVPASLMPLLRRLEIRFLSRADVLLANGDDIAQHYGGYGLPVGVIKNSVSLKKWEMRPPSLQGPVKVLFLGRLTRVKGIEEFLALVELAQRTAHAEAFEFHVVGDGDYAGAVRALAERGWLTYHGVVDNADLPRELAKYDVCVALTLVSATGGGGGTSNALMEQMAAGRVIIAWDNVIFRQLVDAGNACLVRQGDVPGMLDALVRIASDRSAALAMGEAARTAISEYSVEAQVDKFITAVGAPVFAPAAHSDRQEKGARVPGATSSGAGHA